MATNLSTIGQIAVPVKDLARAVAFYRDALGLRFLFQAPPALAFFDCDGIRLMLDVPSEKEFKVDDIDASYADLTSRGVDFRGTPHLIAKMPDHELWMAFFPASARWISSELRRDGEGNTHALMCEKRSAAASAEA